MFGFPQHSCLPMYFNKWPKSGNVATKWLPLTSCVRIAAALDTLLCVPDIFATQIAFDVIDDKRLVNNSWCGLWTNGLVLTVRRVPPNEKIITSIFREHLVFFRSLWPWHADPRQPYHSSKWPVSFPADCQYVLISYSRWWARDKNKKASIRWQDSARHQFQAGLRGDVELKLMATWKARFRLHVYCN